MSGCQRTILNLLAPGTDISAANLAERACTPLRSAYQTCDALQRRNLVTVTDRGAYRITAKGLRRLDRDAVAA